MVEEARLEEVGSGLAPVSPGWFVVNVADAAWLRHDAFGAVETETNDPREAYAPFGHWQRARPDAWADLPWAG